MEILYKNSGYLIVLLSLIVFFAIRIAAVLRIKRSLRQLEYFEADKLTGSFEETKPKFSLNKKSEFGVLLLHGFSSSVNEFSGLIKELEASSINYYAPGLTGFGINDVNQLCNVKYTDWLRDADNAYNILKSVNEKIVILGHSAGGALTLHIAARYNVPHIFLTAPYIIVNRKHKLFHTLFSIPVIYDLIKVINPVVSKSKTRNNHNKKRFVYDAVPIMAVKAVWDLAKSTDLGKLNKSELYLFTGKNDNTVYEEDLLDLFGKSKVKYSHKSYALSGHNILEDKEAESVVKDIMEKLLALVQSGR